MKYLLLPAALLSLLGCSKDEGANASCCTDKDWKTESPHPNLFILTPNVITPNGDGLNDSFHVIAFDRSSSTPNTQITFASRALTVYVPRGLILVYSNTNYQNRFDGHDNNGAKLPDGTYRYALILDDNTVTGNLCIVRQPKSCKCRFVDPNDPLLCN